MLVIFQSLHKNLANLRTRKSLTQTHWYAGVPIQAVESILGQIIKTLRNLFARNAILSSVFSAEINGMAKTSAVRRL